MTTTEHNEKIFSDWKLKANINNAKIYFALVLNEKGEAIAYTTLGKEINVSDHLRQVASRLELTR